MMRNVLDIEPANPNEAAALGYFSLLVQKRLDDLEALWTEKAVQYVPFLPDGLEGVAVEAFRGRATIMAHYRKVFANRRDHVFMIEAIHQTADPDCIIVEAHASSVLGETGTTYRNDYICVFRLEGGLIRELKEYANPLAAMKAFGPAFTTTP